MNTKYHIQKRDLICPYCDRKQEDVHEKSLPLWQPVIEECQFCQKKFKAEAEICFTTHSVCEENEMDHLFESTSIPGFFMCANCEGSERRPSGTIPERREE